MNAQESFSKWADQFKEWMERRTRFGLAVAIAVAAACVATVGFSVLALILGGGWSVIALALAPVVLVLAAIIWPTDLVRKPDPDTQVKLPLSPQVDLDGGMIEERLETLCAVAREQAGIEETRTAAFTERAGMLLGFAGVILALIAAEAKDVFESSASLGAVGKPLGIWFLVAGAVMTTVAAGCALAVLIRRPSVRIETAQLARFLTASEYDDTRGNILHRQLRVLIEQIQEEREINRQLREWFNTGVGSLVVALLCILIHVGVYLERTVETPCEKAAKSAPTQAALVDGPGCWETGKKADLVPN
jgi:hypothetical protein